MKKGYILLIAIFCILFAITLLFIFPKSNTSKSQKDNSVPLIDVKECGTVPTEYLDNVFGNNSQKNDALVCMSEDIRSCKPSRVTLEENESLSSVLTVQKEVDDDCIINFQYIDKTISCNFKKKFLTELYEAGNLENSEWLTPIGLSMFMGLEIVTSSKSGPVTLDMENKNTHEKVSIPCSIS